MNYSLRLRNLTECQASVVFVSPLYYMTSSLVDIQYAETIAPFLNTALCGFSNLIWMKGSELPKMLQE